MKNIYFLLIYFIGFSFVAAAQADSLLVKKDTGIQISEPAAVADSVSNFTDTLQTIDSLLPVFSDTVQVKTKHIPAKTDETKVGEIKIFSGKEGVFYFLVCLLLFFGLTRLAFAKYFTDLFRVFFRTTLKQKQTSEQLLQSPLPSVLMNCFFVLVSGLYVNFLLIHFDLSLNDNFWIQYLYCLLGIALIYLVKFLGLKIIGWMFNVRDATESYIFIVFIINKILGIFLLPFLVILAFASGFVYDVSLIITWIMLGVFALYRVILSTGIARNEIKLKTFHFILYVLGFEVVPVLLIYKLLLIIF